MAADFIPDSEMQQGARLPPPPDSQSRDFISDADMQQSQQQSAQPDFISDADMQRSQPQQAASPDFISDADMAAHPAAESPTMTTARAAASDIIPAVGAIPAMTAGARVGGVAGLALTGGNPVGGFVGMGIGALGGGLIAGGALTKAQDIVKRVLGIDDTEQQRVNAEANPNAALLGSVPGVVAGFKSGAWKGAANIASHLTTAGFMGGVTTAQQAVEGEGYNPKAIALSALEGGVFNEVRGGLPTKLAKLGETVGDRIVKYMGHGTPGPLAASGVAQEATPVKEDVPGIGNTDTQPGERDGGNDGSYAKKAPVSDGSAAVENVQNGVSQEFQDVLSTADATKESTTGSPVSQTAPPAANDNTENAPTQDGAKLDAQFPRVRAPGKVEPLTAEAAPKTPEFNKNAKATAPEADLSRTSDEDLVDASKAQREAGAKVQAKVTAPQKGEAFKPETAEQAAVPERPAKAATAPESADSETIPTGAKPTSYEAPGVGDSYPHVDQSMRGTLIRREQPAPNMVASNRANTEALIDPRVPRVIEAKTVPGSEQPTKSLDPAHALAIRENTRRQILDMLGKEPEQKMPFATQLEASKEAGLHAERMWLEKRGYDADAFQKQIEGFKTAEIPAKAPAAPTYPKFVKRTLEGLRANEKSRPAADALETKIRDLPRAKQISEAGKAAKLLNSRGGKADFTKTLATPRLDKTGFEIDDLGVTAKTQKLADARTKAIEAVEKAFDNNTPKGTETKDQLRARLTRAVGEAKAANDDKDAVAAYRPQDPPEHWHWLNEAQRLIKGRMTEKQIAKFVANEKLLRGGEEDIAAYKADKRGEGETANNPRSGDAALAGAEAEQARKFPGETPHEEAEKDTPPVPVKAADLAPVERTKTLDIAELPAAKQADIKADMAKTTEGLVNAPDDLTGQPAKSKWELENNDRLAAQQEKMAVQKRQREARTLAAKTATKAPEDKPSEVRKVEVTDEIKAKYAGKSKEVKEQAQRESELQALERGVKEEPAANTLKTMFTDEAGSLNPKAIAKTFDAPKSKTYAAKGSRSAEEDYANSLSQDFANLRGGDTRDKIDARQAAKNMPKEVQAIDGKLYKAQDTDTVSSLNKGDKTLFDRWIKPHLDNADTMFAKIEKLAPGLLGPKVANHIWRMRIGGEGDELAPDNLKTGISGDPIQGTTNPLYSGKVGPMYERKFVGLERSDGQRFVISPSEKGGFLSWRNGKPHMVKDPTFEFKDGDTYTNGQNTYKMGQATTDEIEAQTGVKYHKSAIMSAILAEQRLSTVLRHLEYIDKQKSSPEFQSGDRQLATQNAKLGAENKWQTTDLKAFKGWYMHPRLAEVMDDFQRPGFGAADSAWDKVRRFSQQVTKLLFWLPTAHFENVGTHWFTARGLEWLRPRGYKSLYLDGSDAMKSVMTQDAFYKEALDKGAGLIYGSTVTQDIVGQIAHAAGLTIKSDPATWGPVAKTFGVGVDDMVKGIYNASKHAMWYSNDVFLVQHLKENMRNGMSMEDAITQAEKYFPNYRVASRLMGSRFLSKVMQSPELSAFGRYHAGVWNAYANVAKDLLSPNATGKDRAEAVGHLLMMGVLAFGIYPALDKVAQWITNNPDASVYRRGPIAIPNAIARARAGTGDALQAARDTFTIPPLANTGLEALHNKDFANKNIVEPGDVTTALHGSARAGVRVAAQEGLHTAQGLVSPVGTAVNASRNQGILKGIRDQALGIKNPSAKSRAYEKMAPSKNEQAAVTRYAHPSNPVEGWLNSILGHK